MFGIGADSPVIAASAREAAATALEKARVSATPIEPLTETWPGFDVDDAYAVQAILIDRRRSAGASVVGWKVGLTSLAMQRQLGVEEPDFAPLLDRMAIAPGDGIACGALIAPRIEVELGFRLREGLRGPGVGVDSVAAAVGSLFPAFEIVDSRVADWRVELADTIADQASAAGFIVGAEVPLSAVDIRAVTVSVLKNDELVEEGVGSAVLGDPLAAVAWLANAIAAHGQALLPDQVILAGALHASVPIAAGDRIDAVFSDAALGSLVARCQPSRAEAT